MFTLQQPTEARIIAYLIAQQEQPFSYHQVGCSRGKPPVGYDVDHNRVLLGHGEAVFLRAKQAIQHWDMFSTGITTLYWPDRDILEGTVVAVRFRVGPLHSFNTCRIIYTIDETTAGVTRFGFAYGTLPDHLEQGEERFSVEWNHEDDTVSYDLYVVSRPRHWVTRLGYLYTRIKQRQFRDLSCRAMQRAVDLVVDQQEIVGSC